MNYFKQKNVIEGVVSFKKRIQINTNVKVYLIPYDSITNWYSDYQLYKIRDEALEEITSYARANNLSFIEARNKLYKSTICGEESLVVTP